MTHTYPTHLTQTLNIVKRHDGWYVISLLSEVGPVDTEHKARTVRGRIRAEGWLWLTGNLNLGLNWR